MNILYTCDNNYVWLMGISMISLFENNKNAENIKVFLLGENITAQNKKILKDIAKKYKRECNIIDMPELDIPDSLVSKRWPKSAFNRLYSAKLLPKKIKKILYLDCDTIILSSLSNLEKINIDNYFIYGVKDCINARYKYNIGLKKDSVYLNAGVLLMNYEKMRKLDIPNMIDSFLKNKMQYIHYADQDVLNGIFEGKFGVLPANYDVMTLEYMYSYKDIMTMRKPSDYYSELEIKDAIKNPNIVHFTTNMSNVRPWFVNSNHPMTSEFLKYKEISPWKEKKLFFVNQREGLKDKLFKLLNIFPHKIEINLIGVIHSLIFPIFIRIKGFLRGKK